MKTLTEKQEKAIKEVKEICNSNRLLVNRFNALNNAGYSVGKFPMCTGGGIGNFKHMKDGSIRIRVSANWIGNFCNYAYCVHI